ncbi:hypothetical protein DH2020_008646 [Rehmannia glutinosa]|uniref:Uncharacterized protein n=1 Tax=Rehmannia glutinosa TaxID=99300 RepID=A0ABR0X511_REHGL
MSRKKLNRLSSIYTQCPSKLIEAQWLKLARTIAQHSEIQHSAIILYTGTLFTFPVLLQSLPSVSNVQVEPIVVQIDRLDLVLEENDDIDAPSNSSSASSSGSTGKGSGYGFADKVVNLKEAREFSSDKKFIYVFKKLEWEHLSIDLLPHPDMFTDANFSNFQEGANRKDEDGAKRVFFGGERFIEGISGEAHRSAEAAGRSLVSIIVDHIFLCIKDAAENFFPPIYPLGDQQWQLSFSVPLISLHCLQLRPSPSPPIFASKTVIDCQPLMIHLQEESCLRISSFLADGIVVNPGSVLPEQSINSLLFNLNGLDVTIPLEMEKPEQSSRSCNMPLQSSFAGARLHIENLMLSQSPSLKLSLLNLEKDPACFCLWENQPIDASQKKLSAGASLISLSLETCNNLIGRDKSRVESGLWKCVEIKDIRLELAMVTADGSPLTSIPPPGGVVRVGVACQQYLSNTSVEQLFFVLDLYAYFGTVSERIAVVGKNKTMMGTRNESLGGNIMEKAPGDTAVTLAVKDLQLRFLESSADTQGIPLVRFMGDDLFIKVSHRTLGGAIAISSTLWWERVEVDCTDTVNDFRNANGSDLTLSKNGDLEGKEYGQLRAVFWVQNSRIYQSNRYTTVPFLDISMVHVIPYSAQDIECHSLNVSACIAGIRLGGGMNYAESLLHRFGILGPDGGPGEGLTRGLEHLSGGPLSKLFKASPLIMDGLRENGSSEDGNDSSLLHLGAPDDVDVSIELKDWLFALEGAQEMNDRFCSLDSEDCQREERSWHTTFRSVHVKAKSSPKHVLVGTVKPSTKQKYPIELITVGMEGLQILKPTARQGVLLNGISKKGILQNGLPESEKQIGDRCGGVNMAVDVVASEDVDDDDTMGKWEVENLKFSVNEPIEAVVKKDELQYLAILCKSEVDSLGRIAAGVLRILKLEGSVGTAAISQLSNLGSESFDTIFTPKKSGRGSSASNTGLSPSSNVTGGSPSSCMESTMASLEEAVLDSQTKCAALATELSCSESSAEYLDNVKQLSEKLESMQKLLNQLRTQF